MYILDFFRRTIRKGNIPILIYLGVNLFIISFLIKDIFKIDWIYAILYGCFFYGLSLTIALSPIGEWILRLQTGCKKIRRKDMLDFIMPIFEEVYENAKKTDSTLSNDIKLFISSEESANAFATGRKTVCITKGMLNAPADEIKAVLAHEMGHLAHKDTDLILVISIGNFMITACLIAIRLFARFIFIIFQLAGIFGGEAAIHLGAWLSGLITDLLLVFFMKFWTKFGMLLVMKSSRNNEYYADKFSAELGYGEALCTFLDRFNSEGFDGLFAALMSSHPDADDRIAELQSLGVKYGLVRES